MNGMRKRRLQQLMRIVRLWLIYHSAEQSRLAGDDIDSDDIALETKALLKAILNNTKLMAKHADTLSVEAGKFESFSSLLKLMVNPQRTVV
jgi:hypothetical protein